MSDMEQKAQDAIEGGLHAQKECYEEIRQRLKNMRQEYEGVYDIPDFLSFDGEDYMYYGEDPVLTEQWDNTMAQWRGFCAGYKSRDEAFHRLEAEKELLKDEMDGRNQAAANALDKLWKEILEKEYPDYGDWEYPGMVYRHIVLEFKSLKAENKKLHQDKIDIHYYLMGTEDDRDTILEEVFELLGYQRNGLTKGGE